MNHCWKHRAWDEVDDLFHRGVELLRMGFKAFAYPCPDCGKERKAFFSDEAAAAIAKARGES